MDSIIKEQILNCKSYAEAIRILYGKNYTNGKLQEKVRQDCLNNGIDFQSVLEKNNTKHCLNCGKILELKSQSKFCSSSCAATYNNKIRGKHTEETKNKISSALKDRYKLKRQNEDNILYKPDSKYIFHKCVCCVCGKEFWSRHKKSVHCSRTCVSHDERINEVLRQAQYKAIENRTHVMFSEKQKISFPERYWMDVLDKANIKYKYNVYTLKRYFLDFLIEKGDLKIDLEIDGKQHLLDDRVKHDNERNMLLQQAGYIVYRVPWNSVNTHIGKERMKKKVNDFFSFYENLK